ncbi:MAG TPA: serine/threonine-protein kinase [Candidatus Obscuribacterales bacterium]
MLRRQCLSCKRNFDEAATLCDECDMPLATVLIDSLVGTVLNGRYTIQSELGHGGMGIVYGGVQRGLDRKVAIKLLLSNIRQDEIAVKRFEAEAKALSQLNHPNIVSIFDFDVSELGLPFIVMEFLEGRSLHDLLSQKGTLTAGEAVPLFMQLCDALGHAHRRRLVHRDLKPSNVMLVEDDGGMERPVLVDFGIAKMFSQAGAIADRLTRSGEVFGSPLYMSPEQCMGQAMDQRSDVYSLGCMMYGVLSGKTPFEGRGFLQVVFSHVNDAVAPLRTVAPARDIPESIEAIVMKAVSKNSEDRYQSMFELKHDLQAWDKLHASDIRPEKLLSIKHPAADEEKDRRRQDAEAGDTIAQYDLALSYMYGDDGEKDMDLAIYWLTKSAMSGYSEAQASLALNYQTGHGVEKDPERAAQWFLKAAEQGNAFAQFQLGCCYNFGEGVKKSEAEAYHWFRRAAEQGDPYAQNSLGGCYEFGRGVSENLDLAFEWYRRSAEQGCDFAQLNVGQMYERGQAVRQDYKEAARWYQMAADQGLSAALYRLALLFRDGLGVEKDEAKFLSLLTRAAEGGCPDAQYDLAKELETTASTKSDFEEVLRWLGLAGEEDIEEAQKEYFALRKRIKREFS